MTMIRKLAVLGIVPAILVTSAFLITASAFGAASKVWICHGTGNGDFIVIEVAEQGWLEGHLAHQDHLGDLGPEDGVPQPATGDPNVDCVGGGVPPG